MSSGDIGWVSSCSHCCLYRMKSLLYASLILWSGTCYAVDRNNFKTCEQSSFCRFEICPDSTLLLVLQRMDLR
uniref:Uncharacterized protein n=1 Tax=Eptatretus burgeri TaxID=7764 RepID=A0A8C4RAN6_EPTBU